jgi:hypothetical protein
MAELYAKPYEVIDTGYNPQQTQQGGQNAEMQSYLESLPPEERQKAMERINSPLSGEELALMAQSGQKAPTLEEYAEIEKWHKGHEISFIDGIGKIAEAGGQVMSDITNAMGSFVNNPSDATSKMPATAVEAFAQGTRNFYGMLAQSGNPDSALFRVKDFLNGTGRIEDRYNQYMEALKFNRDSADLAEGKQTLVMDKDMINHEITQAMAYIADPTLFIPFGKVASTGLRAIGLGEKLTMAGARSAAIKNGILGNTLKWGAGQPLEFLGGAVRNTIDYGLEKAGAAFEATTGMEAKQFAQTARMSGIGFSASAVAGHAVPYASTISDAYIVGSSAKGFGEALTLMGETMSKNKFGRGINSWAAESLEQAEKNGVALSPHAKGLLKTLNAVDPLFAYGWNGLEGAAEGALIGGVLGYASGGEEGMYSGIGAGVALGGVGATAGKAVADVTGGTNVARRAVQAKMVIEGHKVTNPDKAMFFQAMQTTAEARGQDVDLVNGIIAGIDKVAPNFEFHALTPDQFKIEAIRKGYNPFTGKFAEFTALSNEFGSDRASKSKAMYILRSVGGDFVGDSKSFLAALKKASAKDSTNPNKPAGNIPANLRKYTDVAKTFDKLTKTQQDAVLKEIDGQANFSKELGGSTKLREHYDALSWSEAWTDSLVKKFESDREGARKDIIDMLSRETKKNGERTLKGQRLVDKLTAEGFLDRDGKLLRKRNLHQADMTLIEFASTKGGVMRRDADGKTHMYINLNNMGSETFPHELFHTIMRESPMKDHFTKSLIQKLVGSFDAQGNLVRNGEVNVNQLRKFFKKYIDLTSFDEDGTMNPVKAEETMKAVEIALGEYEQSGKNKKISAESRDLLEKYTEEFGAYYFSHWLMGRNRNTLFFGGELKGIEGLVERTKDSFMDFWQSKISKANPEFDFSKGLNESFSRSKGLGRISSMDYYMRDMVRAASNANRDAFKPDSMTLENLRDFEQSNGLRNLTNKDGNRRLNPPERKKQNHALGKEGFKILSGLDKNLRTSKDTIDENGKPVITGRLSEAELDALVKGGIVPRAWADKVNQGYAMLDGTVSNVYSAGYLGFSEQTTDASYPRLYGKDVAFKNRKAILFDIETKIKADGTFYTLFHNIDLAVVEQRGNHLWQNTDYRNLWNGDRGAMEADFFRYISNASKASTDTKKLDSAALLEKGDGLGAQRRDVLQQMAGMALQTGDAYKHQPIAVIPEGIRHSVTTFNIDGLTTPRVEQGARYDIDMKNAHKFIRENWQPDDMRQEKTPVGRVLTHESGFKFTQDANGKVSAYTSVGAKIGTFNSIKEATVAGKNKFNDVYKNHDAEVKKVFEKKNEEAKRFQALDENERQEAIRNGDLFSLERVKNFIGNRKVLRQSREEFIISKVIEAVENPEILKNSVTKALSSTNKTAIQYRKLLQEFVKVGEEEKRLANEHGVLYQQWLKTTDADKRSMLSQKMTENSEAAQVLQVQRPKAKFNLERFELEMQKERVEAFVELQNSMSHLTPEQFTEVVKNELMLTYNPELGGKYKAIKKAHSGIAETLFAKEFDDQTQTGVPIVVVGTHGTRNVELMISRILLDEKLGSRYGTAAGGKAYSSDLGHFMGGSTDTSSSYSGIPPSAFTEYAKNGIPVNRLAEFLGDGAFLNPYGFPESHPVYRLNKAIFELKKNSQKVNDALLFKAQDAYLELFDKGDKLSYDDLLAKAREVQGILSHLKDIRYISDNAHRNLINLTVEAFDKSVRKERQNRISRDEFNDYLNNAEVLVINPMFSPLDEMRVSVDELLGGELKNQDKEIKLPEGKSIKVKYDNELYKEVIKLSQETINTLTDTFNGWMGKTNFENKVKMVIGGKKFYEGSSTVEPAKTWMQIRMLMAFDNPKVIIDPRGYDESKLAPQMIQAINEGHDGIIFKRLRDGGSEDDIYIQLKGNQNKILTIDTSFDSQHIPRKDENGNVLKTGRDIGLALQPDEVDAPKQVQGIKLDMTKAYDVFRQEYEESTGQSWSQDKFMQRARNWQFFGDENGFVAVRPQRSGFVKLVGMAGDNKSKLRGIQQIQQQGLPIWGMVSKDIKDMAVKRGMREPNMIERTVLKQALNSAALGDAEILGYTSDNGVRLRYPDIGEVTKYMIGSPEYYQKLRSAFGEQVKSKIGFQPAEGGADSVATRNKITLDTNGVLSKLGMNLKDKTKMEIWMRHLTDDPATALEKIREEGLVGWMKNRAQSVIDAEVESWDAGYKELKHQQKVAQQFLDKVESGKIDTTNFMPAEGDNYRGSHKAPSGESGEGSLDAMDRTYPEDIYSVNGARYYGTREKSDAEMISIIQNLRGKPDELVSVYRAVPKGTKGEINAGDWVTPSKAYARLHGGRWEEGMRIIEKKVPAKELFTEGNSIYEFGWSPKKKSRADVLREEIASDEKWMERRRSQAPVLWETKGSKIYRHRMDIERRISSLKYELNRVEREGKTSFQPAEGVNAPVNEVNRNFILDTISGNENSRRALEEGMKQAKDRKQNFITIDNINPELLRGEAVVMHSPDNAGVEPVQIGRFTVNPRGGMRFPSENPTLGWAGVKAGLGKQINDNGNYNADKGKGWSSGVGLIKGEYSKMKGTHIGLEVFLRNLQKYTDNNVLTERQTIQILKNGLGDIGDTKRPLDTIVEGILAKSAKHEPPYTIDGRRTAIEKMTETDGSASLWKYLQSDLTKLESQTDGFTSEGVTNAKQFIKALLEPMYEAVSDPLTRHAKVGEVYGYLMFRSPVTEPMSDVHPSYKYAVQPEKGGSPVQLDILSTPMSARKAFTNRITAGEVSPLPESEAGFKVSTGQKHIPTMRGTFMPAEFTEFKSEQSPTGRILRNAKGYVIMLANNKFRVYNPSKAIIGVYGSEEEAKKRIYKEIPKR